MKTKRIFNLVSLFMNMLVIMFTVYAMVYNFRTDIVQNDAWFGFRGFKCLRFFTVLSNVYAAIACGIMLFFNAKNIIGDEYDFPLWASVVKFSATAAVSLTFVTVVFFLAPYAVFYGKSYFSLFTNNNFFMHFLSPVLCIASTLVFERSEPLGFKRTVFGVLPAVAYSLVYTPLVIIGEENGGWPDFYGFTFGGNYIITPFVVIGIYAAAFAISVLLVKLKAVFAKKIAVEPSESAE